MQSHAVQRYSSNERGLYPIWRQDFVYNSLTVGRLTSVNLRLMIFGYLI
jgi:hypothetical protein